MCNSCVKEEYPDRGSICLEDGSFLNNFSGCAQCHGLDVISIENRTLLEDEDDVCKVCSHLIASHLYTFRVEDDYQEYEMSCLLCGSSEDSRSVLPCDPRHQVAYLWGACVCATVCATVYVCTERIENAYKHRHRLTQIMDTGNSRSRWIASWEGMSRLKLSFLPNFRNLPVFSLQTTSCVSSRFCCVACNPRQIQPMHALCVCVSLSVCVWLCVCVCVCVCERVFCSFSCQFVNFCLFVLLSSRTLRFLCCTS